MKKALSFVMAIVLIIAMIPISSNTLVANAACTSGTTDLLEFGDYLIEAGSTSKWYDSVLVDNGETGTKDDPIIIDTAEEFVYLAKGISNDTVGKYYKVADGISAFDLSRGNLDFNGTLKQNISAIMSSGKNHSGGSPGFQGTFDGNGVTVYGAWTNHTEGNVGMYAGLFSVTRGDVTIKNINVKFASFTAKNTVGGIVGYHAGNGNNSLTIENCSVSDSHLEVTTSGFGVGIGGIVGYAENLSSYEDTEDTDGDGDTTETIYVNGAVNIKNCFVNLDEEYFISSFEKSTQTDTTLRGVHGGIAGFISTNALSVSDCIVLGITPYATTSCNTYADVQHSGLPSHFTNVYTDQISGTDILIGGTGYTSTPKDFTGRVTQLTKAQIKGFAAVDNMNLDWSIWLADDENYPELRSAHKEISYVKNNDGTHSETCICGFGGLKSACTLEKGKCTICEADLSCSEREIIYWDGTIATGFIDQSAGTKNDPVIINTAAELAYLISSKVDVSTLSDGSPKYFKIADGIGTIVLQDTVFANDILDLKTAAEVKTFFEKYSSWLYPWPNKGWEQSSFCGYFDGNGVKIYGLYQQSSNNAGLFSSIDGGASIHNIAVMNSYLSTTATNYQIGAIAAVGNGVDYGIKTNGVIWFDSCIVANCYMRSSVSDSNANKRAGIIMGNSYEEAVIVDNCLVYGNDAYYGDSYQYKIPLIGMGRNNIKSDSRKPAELDVKIQTNVNDTDVDMFYNMVRNTVALGCDIVNTRMHYSYRLNEPDCFENCYTDGVAGTVEFTDGSWKYTDKQIKSITAEELKGVGVGNAWFATDTLPELRAFHYVTAVDNTDGTHSLYCDCGISGISEAHILSKPQYQNTVVGNCTTNGSYDLVYYCTECYIEISRETISVDATGHTYEDDIVTECSTCGESRVAFIHGDANNDNVINGRDYSLIIQHINGWELNIVYDACDVNRDGKINGRDVAIVMQYLNGWDVCIHRYTAATCTSPKSCIYCEQTTGEKLGHNYVAGECNRVNKGVLCNDFNEDYCPKLYFTGDMSEITLESQRNKDIVCNIDVEYRSKEQIVNRSAKIKIQGSSSTQWRKKNYTITFYEDDSYENKMGIDVGWGEQSKYCLKANWIDKTHSRNVVTAKLAGEMQKKYGLLNTAPNNGAIDGFPVEVYINGEFHGLYTMNIPKDEWQFNMDKDNPNHIVIGGDNWAESVLFKEIPTDFSGWEVEVGPDDDATLSKVQRLVDFVLNSSDEDFKSKFSEYLNLDSTLNYYIMMNYAWMPDNVGKNMLLATYDGNVWYPSLYDLDTTWGAHWTGGYLYNYSSGVVNGSNSLLWQRFEEHFKPEIAARYFELRSSVLDTKYVMSKFNEFYSTIPQEILERETEKWTRPNDPIPGFDLSQIQDYLDTVVPRLDDRFSSWYVG
ncbi:MAG: CotH kinase family protein [Clostridia bacterium]|nr:CotH kinase family protein [Clostridia bacterium]